MSENVQILVFIFGFILLPMLLVAGFIALDIARMERNARIARTSMDEKKRLKAVRSLLHDGWGGW